MKFKRGDRIEVVDMGSGFVGSFYDGNIVSRVGKKTYIVQFRTLLEDDHSGFLREFVTADKKRPKPVDVSDFVLSQKVDDFANDGWWVGRIASNMGPFLKKILVSLQNSSDLPM
ncbi:protein AGENET DOMAIN (AGD)-CONTAINING P1-like [Bidens hawaiensis]|uniref:protein AGENET DOMAIN (AGD)-CONTAINING P1-like n=1 Tax=Bidens hawaiensis TaxID=980011 RepID=UPI00404A5C57